MVVERIKYHMYMLALLGLSLALGGCSTTREYREVCVGETCAPKRATSRPYQIKGVWYYPQTHYEYDEVGIASYYGGGDIFHGRPTATGERFDMNEVSAAHKTLPLPCVAEVTNIENGRQIQLKVNDRGPFIAGRILDVSRRTAQLLGFDRKGTAKVRVRTLVPESLALNGLEQPQVMLAQKDSPPVSLPSPLPPSIPSIDALLDSSIPDHLFEEEEEAPILMMASHNVSKPSPPSQRGVYIDVGAYEQKEEFEDLLKPLSDLTKKEANPIHNGGIKPYAVRVGPFTSMAEANQILDQVVNSGHGMARIIIQ